MTELSFTNKITFESKKETLNNHPKEEWLKLIWQWAGTREINYSVFKTLIEYMESSK